VELRRGKVTFTEMERLVLVYEWEGLKEAFWELSKQNDEHHWIVLKDESGAVWYLDFDGVEFGIYGGVHIPAPLGVHQSFPQFITRYKQDQAHAYIQLETDAITEHKDLYTEIVQERNEDYCTQFVEALEQSKISDLKLLFGLETSTKKAKDRIEELKEIIRRYKVLKESLTKHLL